MTLSQLDSLTEDELAMCLYIVNVIRPVKPPMKITPRGLTWFKHDALVKKLLDAFQEVKPEAHPIFVSMMLKLGVKVEITPIIPSPTEATGSDLTETTSSKS